MRKWYASAQPPNYCCTSHRLDKTKKDSVEPNIPLYLQHVPKTDLHRRAADQPSDALRKSVSHGHEKGKGVG